MAKKRKAVEPGGDQPLPAIASMNFWSRLKNPPPMLAFAFPEVDDIDDRLSLRKLLQIPRVPADDSFVYSIKISLDGLVPQVWRRVITRSVDLEHLHYIIQIVMGWGDCHLHEFEVKNTSVPLPDEGAAIDEQGLTIDQLYAAGIKKFQYTYDFGDSWKHTVRIEKQLPADGDTVYPLCASGKEICPIEDCGGLPGWARLLDAMEHPDHITDGELEEMLDWLNIDELQPFSAESATADLQKVFKKKPKKKRRSS